VFEDLVVRSVGAEHIVEADPDAVGAVQPKAQQGRVRAVVKEACPKCGHPELQYYTMQLRSADEGQTVFYECAKCGHTFSTNT
jgi:DNA-directed RNA polymerase I subunit RPA12